MVEVPSLSYVLHLAGNDFEFREKFVAILKHEFHLDRIKYFRHIDQDEPRAAAEVVHKLMYKISVLGMKRSFAFTEHYEDRLRAGDMKLDLNFRSILNDIDRYLKTL